MGDGNYFFWFGVFSGSFGVRSIVLCKCSGNVLIGYIYILCRLYKVNISMCAGVC